MKNKKVKIFIIMLMIATFGAGTKALAEETTDDSNTVKPEVKEIEINNNQETNNVENKEILEEATKNSEAKGTVIETTTGSKDFFTIKTNSEKIFYLIIDKEKTNDNVYLLTEVSEKDLLNFLSKSEKTGGILGSLDTQLSDVDSDYDANENEEKGELTEKAKEKVKGNSKKIGIILIVMCIGVVIVYYVRKKKKSKLLYDFDDDVEEYEERKVEKNDNLKKIDKDCDYEEI